MNNVVIRRPDTGQYFSHNGWTGFSRAQTFNRSILRDVRKTLRSLGIRNVYVRIIPFQEAQIIEKQTSYQRESAMTTKSAFSQLEY